MSDFVLTEPAKVVIGVCGEQGSGKTIFLTCFFQSIWSVFPEDFVIDFDRKEIGNATYFQSVEDSLLAKMLPQGTIDNTLYPARIYVRPYEPFPAKSRSELSVDLLDFAGRHFRSMADLKDLREPSESDPDDVKALREVNETLERADAFVILINSTEIDPLNEAPKRNPFSPSVNFMLSHCRAERKPVALLFSQIDQTPRLTEELFHSLPRVQAFERMFTQDLQEASRPGGRPFGIVRRITCYETIPGDLVPRKQTDDGSIWRREPAEVVLELLRAAMPRIKERLLEAERTERQKEQERELAEHRRQRRQWTFRLAALLGILAALLLLVFGWYKKTEIHQVRLLNSVVADLREGKIAAISPLSEAGVGEILAKHRASPSQTPSSVRAAIEDLETALGEAGQRLAGGPSLEPTYAGEVARFQSLLPRFDPAVTELWGPKLLPILTARGEFLSDWFGTQRQERRARTSFLDQSVRRFVRSGDRAFASLLAAQSTKEKEAEVVNWQTRIDADADVTSRLATIQSLLASALAEKDLEFSRIARKALAGQLIATILKRQENGFLRDKLLTPLAPDLAKLGDGEVRFDVLASDLLACANEGECQSRQETLQSAITDAETVAASWSSGVENLLRSLVLDLPLTARAEVWDALAEGLSSSYLFSSREDAWPSGARPLAWSIQQAANADSNTTEDLIERIARHPIYRDELLYLGDRLTAMVASRQVVPIYTSLLTELAEKENMLETNGLTVVREKVSSVLAERTEADGPLAEIGNEIGQILSLVQSVNSQRARGGLGDPSAAVRLERLLRDAKADHCASLESHDEPTECANAA